MLRTFIDYTAPALATIDAIRTRVRSTTFWGGAWQKGGRVIEIGSGHDPMISEPARLSELRVACAAREGD